MAATFITKRLVATLQESALHFRNQEVALHAEEREDRRALRLQLKPLAPVEDMPPAVFTNYPQYAEPQMSEIEREVEEALDQDQRTFDELLRRAREDRTRALEAAASAKQALQGREPGPQAASPVPDAQPAAQPAPPLAPSILTELSSQQRQETRHAPSDDSVADVPIVTEERVSLGHLPSNSSVAEPLETKLSEIDSLRLHLDSAAKVLLQLKAAGVGDKSVLAPLEKKVAGLRKALEKKASLSAAKKQR